MKKRFPGEACLAAAFGEGWVAWKKWVALAPAPASLTGAG